MSKMKWSFLVAAVFAIYGENAVAQQMATGCSCCNASSEAKTADAPVADTAAVGASSEKSEIERWERLDAVAKQAASVQTYRAAFEQEKFTPLLREPVKSQGQVRLAGGIARWDTDEPYASTMIAQGSELRLYYPDQQTLEVYDLGDRMDQLAASPVPDLTRLREFFTLESIDENAEKADRLDLLLLPRTDELAENLEEVLAQVDTEKGVLSRIEVTDTNGETTVMTFSDIELNPQIEAEALKLEVPENTKVVRPLEATGG
jgi:outer membrane lipoprotein carrier protein